MRIAEFTLERYGRFEDHRLTLPKQDQDFHLIYGPNEAGKTTTLCALADLLFGFEHRVAHAYRFPAQALRVGAMLENGGEHLSLRRRRGRTGTLVNAEDAPLDEGRLSAMLHGMSRDAFLQSSSLDHARLRDGGRAMVESRDDLGQMLFAAGSGVTNLKQVLTTLDEELDALWGQRRSERRAFTRAETLWKEARSKLKETSVKPAEWSRSKTELNQATKAFLDADVARRQAAAALADVERLRRVYPLLARRKSLLDDLASHAVLVVPEATEAAARGALEVAAQQQQKRDAAHALLEAVQATLQSEPDQAPVIAVGDQVDALVQDLSAELQRRQDQPALEADLAGARTTAQTLSATLDLTPEQALKAALPPSGVIQQLRDHVKRRVELATRAKAAGEAAATAREECRAADQLLAAAAPPSELTKLEAAVQVAQRAGDIDEQIGKQMMLAEREEEALARSLQTLQPWSGAVSELIELVPLPDEAVDEAAAQVSAAKRSAEQAQRVAADRAEALDLAKAKAEALAEGEGVVSFEMVREARDARDKSIKRIGQHLGSCPPLTSPGEEIEELKRSVTAADELADRRFAAAEAAAQLAGARAEVAQADIRHRHAQDQIAQALTAVQRVSADWMARLNAQHLPNLAPEELRAWIRRRALCLTAKQAVDDAEAEGLRLRTRRERLHQELATALGREAGNASEPLEPVLAEASGWLEVLKRAASAFDALKADAKSAYARQEEALRNLKSAERQVEEWQSQWDAITAEVGLSLQPNTADIRLSALEELGRAREQAQQVSGRRDRLEALSKAFANRAREIAVALSLRSDHDPVDLVRRAKALLEAARTTAARRHTLQEQADQHAKDRAAADAALAAAETALSDALTLTGSADRLTLAEALDRARERRELEERLKVLDQELVEQTDGVALAELEEACASLSFDELGARAEDGRREAEEATTRAQDARSIMAEAAQHFKQFEAQEDAAGWASEVELARAEMDGLADAYIMKKTQRLLLGHAMKRQGERARHPLLTRAAELFRTLTLQRYANLVVDRDADKPRLLGVCDNGDTMVQIDDMSEGTQDQLFLALRLAAVEQSITSGSQVPFLADDLFVTFDDDRARSGLQVLGELSRTTQVLFFTHHAHLRDLAETLFPSLLVHDLQEAA